MAKGATAGKVEVLADFKALRAMVADAEPVKTVRKQDPEPGESRNGVPPGCWKPGPLGLPEDCPVQPLGKSGSVLWFLDDIGQVRAMDEPYGKGSVLGLFNGRLEYLIWAWPRWGKEKNIVGFHNDKAGAALIAACATKGVFDVAESERWRGCWRDSGGGLVVHCGSSVIVGGRAEPPGEFDQFVYPARRQILKPWPGKDEPPVSLVQLLRTTLRRWNWERPEIDPHLLLGWIGAAFLGGALTWRPMVFITGDKATGKSTLQGLLKSVLGDWLVQAADTTAAGLYQRIGLGSLPIAVDELEAEADNRKVVAVLALARLASSGAVMLRGGADHKGSGFNARSAFLFSAINAPPLPPAELSRMALLNLRKLESGQPVPVIEPGTFALAGRCVLRRLMDEWDRLEETIGAFAKELGAAGMDGRGQAQFGTLLAIADMIEHKGWDESRLKFALEHEGELVAWRELLRPEAMLEFEDMTENWRGCLAHLLGVRVEAWRGGVRQTVGQLLEAYYRKTGDVDTLEANRDLAQAGLKIHFPTWAPREPYLAVHNQGPLVRQLFENSKWAGSQSAGVWSRALRQGPKGELWEVDQVRINGVQARATLIGLGALYGKGGIMMEGEKG